MMRIEEYIRKNRPMLDADQPDEDLIWVGISQSLEKYAKKRRIQHWRYAWLAAAMVVIAFAAGYYVLQNDTQIIEQNTELFAISTTTENNEASPISASQKTTPIMQIAIVEPTNEKKMTVEIFADNKYIEQPETSEIMEEPEDRPVILSLGDSDTPSFRHSEPLSLDISLLEDKAAEDGNVTKKTEKWILAAAFGMVSAGGITDTDNEYMYNDVTYSLRKSAIIGEDPQVGHQSLYYMNKDDFTNMQHRPPLSFGIKARKNFNRHIGVESGLVYTYLASRFEWSGYDTKQNLHYMGLPVNLVVYTGNAKSNWRFYISGGGMVEKGLRNISRQVRRLGSETRITTISAPIDGLQWSLNGSLGVSYKLEKSWGIYFEPRIGYSFTNDQPISIRTEYPLSFGINLGLNYEF